MVYRVLCIFICPTLPEHVRTGSATKGIVLTRGKNAMTQYALGADMYLYHGGATQAVAIRLSLSANASHYSHDRFPVLIKRSE